MAEIPLQIPAGCPIPPAWPPPPDWWDLVVVACSNGKDSRVLLHQAYGAYPRDRLLSIYNLLGNEHAGSPQETAFWCDELGLPLLYTWKDERNRSRYGAEIPPAHRQGSLNADLVVALTRRRGRWPGPACPLCGSAGKRDPSDVLIRHVADEGPGHSQDCDDARLVAEVVSDVTPALAARRNRPAKRILLLTGERAEESSGRARKPEWQLRRATSSRKGRLVVWRRAILQWNEVEVWDYLRRYHIPVPVSYRQGFSRHSCLHCVFKSWPEMVLAFVLVPEPAALRVVVEEKVGHRVNLGYRFETHQGFRAVWEFVFGRWPGGIPDRFPAPRSEALDAIAYWRDTGRLFRLPAGVLTVPAEGVAGPGEAR